MHYLLTIILMVLAAIHFYWAIGGRWRYEYVLPENGEGEKEFTPGP